ncbi:MAG: hypothetical protein ABI972_24710, partial [Acidobacteriota bacterium]
MGATLIYNKEKYMMRTALLVLAFLVALSGRAQPAYQVTPALTYGAAETKKKQPVVPIFWSAALKQPPLPFNPYPDLPLYDAGTNNFIYDDREVDYPALNAARAAEQAELEAQNGLALSGVGGGGGGMAMMSMSGGLRLGSPTSDGTNLQLTIEGAEEGARYDVYFSTNLIHWHYLLRTASGQTSVPILPPAGGMCFFQLGTLQDSDDDTLPDAFETLITQTDPLVMDTVQTAGTNAALAALLVDVAPDLYLYSRDEAFISQPLYGPCAFPDRSVYTKINGLGWTNRIGGKQSIYYKQEECVNSNLTQLIVEEETVWAADDTGCYRWRYNGGAWSTGCTNEDGVPTWPRLGGGGGTSSFEEYTQEANVGEGDWEFISQTIQDKLRLETRGPAMSTNSRIYRIRAWVVATLPNGTLTNVPPDQIQVLGQTLGENNELFTVLEDNTTNNVTPTLLADYDRYGFQLAFDRVDVQLTRGTNITDTTQIVCVGQQMNLYYKVSEGYTASNHIWVVPGLKIADWVYSET